MHAAREPLAADAVLSRLNKLVSRPSSIPTPMTTLHFRAIQYTYADTNTQSSPVTSFTSLYNRE